MRVLCGPLCLVALSIFLALLASTVHSVRPISSMESLKNAEQKRHWDDESDLVRSLPGYVMSEFASRHHAGYINVGKTGKRLFYWFVESEGSPLNDPVVLWLNGGPGCSSFDGFVYEHGPFTFQLATNGRTGEGEVYLHDNPYGWQKAANVIFLDSPAGVGLSYSTSGKGDYMTDDDITAADADNFLRGFFNLHPSFKPNPFFITGESYAGVYVPNLARAVVAGNKKGEKPHINLKGYMVGNGVTDQVIDANAFLPFVSGKSLVSQSQAKQAQAACEEEGGVLHAVKGSDCDTLINGLIDQVSNLNVYDILEDCFLGQSGSEIQGRSEGDLQDPRFGEVEEGREQVAREEEEGEEEEEREGAQSNEKGRSKRYRLKKVKGVKLAKGGGSSEEKEGMRNLERQNSMVQALLSHPPRSWPLLGSTPEVGKAVQNWGHLGLVPPCTDVRVADIWLNDPEVREAIHAESVDTIGHWTICSDKLMYMRVIPSLIPIHKNLTQLEGLRALIYSGDHDMAVPHTGSEAWTSGPQLNATLVQGWRPWMVGHQVAGYTVEYKGLSYATFKGAGHMVPENKPRQALAMLERFLANEPL